MTKRNFLCVTVRRRDRRWRQIAGRSTFRSHSLHTPFDRPRRTKISHQKSSEHSAPRAAARDGVRGRDADGVLRARARARGRASFRAARRTVRVPGPRARPRGVSDHPFLGTVRRRGRAQAGDAAVPAAVREAHAARRADRAAPGIGHRASHLACALPRRPRGARARRATDVRHSRTVERVFAFIIPPTARVSSRFFFRHPRAAAGSRV